MKRTLVLAFAIIITLLLHQAVMAVSTCILEGTTDAPPFEWTTQENCTLCAITVKTATDKYHFTSDESGDCYAVTGIGTQFASVERVNAECAAIVAVKWSADCTSTAAHITELTATAPGLGWRGLLAAVLLSTVFLALVKWVLNGIENHEL